MLKKYIDEYRIEGVPRNGIITIEEIDEQGNVTTRKSGVSNLYVKLENDIALANKNGYYEYVEDEIPEYNEETQYITCKYVLENNVIAKVWEIQSYTEIEDIGGEGNEY